jgi:hypothetical protein
LSLTVGNDRLLKYHLDRYKRPGKILDICDGTEVALHQQEMSDSFVKYRDQFIAANPGSIIDECSLCLTFFYDGGINYKRGADSMWPLVTSVVNCNPSDRTKLGIGCSLSLLHNMAGSGVEKFLLQLYAKELKALENGVVFVVAGDCATDDRNVFLQARLMYMHVDTKALESVSCSKGSNSLMSGVKYPFQQTGFLKSHDCFVMLMVYLPYLLSFTDLHENYQEFFARYAYDMHCYLNPCLDAETLREEIIPSIYETRMCQEGLFPDSECVYIFHEIIDIILCAMTIKESSIFEFV